MPRNLLNTFSTPVRRTVVPPNGRAFMSNGTSVHWFGTIQLQELTQSEHDRLELFYESCYTHSLMNDPELPTLNQFVRYFETIFDTKMNDNVYVREHAPWGLTEGWHERYNGNDLNVIVSDDEMSDSSDDSLFDYVPHGQAYAEEIQSQWRVDADGIGVPTRPNSPLRMEQAVIRYHGRIADEKAYPMLRNTPTLQQERSVMKIERWTAGLSWMKLQKGALSFRIERGSEGGFHLQFWLAVADSNGHGVSRRSAINIIFPPMSEVEYGAGQQMWNEGTGFTGQIDAHKCICNGRCQGCWVTGAAYCIGKTISEGKDGTYSKGHAVFGKLKSCYVERLFKHLNPAEPSAGVKSDAIASLVKMAREAKTLSVDEFATSLTDIEDIKASVRCRDILRQIFLSKQKQWIKERFGSKRIVVWLYGETGAGKDLSAVHVFGRQFLQQYGYCTHDDESFARLIYEVNQDVPYWEGYTQQPVLLYSDLRLKDKSNTNALPLHAFLTQSDRIDYRIQNVKNSYTYVCSKFLIVTMIKPPRYAMDGDSGNSNCEQIARRCNIIAEVKRTGEGVDNFEYIIDKCQLPEERLKANLTSKLTSGVQNDEQRQELTNFFAKVAEIN